MIGRSAVQQVIRGVVLIHLGVISSGSCEEIDGDGPDKELLLRGGCG
jgi:hypothetical protein